MSAVVIDTDYKDKLIEKYRDINVDWGDWWDLVYEDFVEDCAKVGIEVQSDSFEFSLGYSQSDYANFKSDTSDVLLYIKAHDNLDNYPMVQKLLAEGGYVRFSTGSMYKHAVSTVVNSDTFLWVVGSDHPFQELWDGLLDEELCALELTSDEVINQKHDELYRKLREACDWLTSDEVVWDTIVANELDKEEQDDE